MNDILYDADATPILQCLTVTGDESTFDSRFAQTMGVLRVGEWVVDSVEFINRDYLPDGVLSAVVLYKGLPPDFSLKSDPGDTDDLPG